MDPLDVELTDADLLGEVEMTAALIVAANQSDRHLTTAEIDAILGVAHPETAPGSATAEPERVRDDTEA